MCFRDTVYYLAAVFGKELLFLTNTARYVLSTIYEKYCSETLDHVVCK